MAIHCAVDRTTVSLYVNLHTHIIRSDICGHQHRWQRRGLCPGVVVRVDADLLASQVERELAMLNWEEKIKAAYDSGCRRFDAAIKGYGGCPMAKDDLTGNMPTENLLSFFDHQNVDLQLDKDAFLHALVMTNSVFPLD